MAHSMLGVIAGAIAPVFAPAGFGTVEASTAVLTGVMAKESVVSTLSVLAGVDPGQRADGHPPCTRCSPRCCRRFRS